MPVHERDSYQIERLGQAVKDRLVEVNPLLRPDKLSIINKQYSFFHPLRHGNRIWSSLETQGEILKHSFQHQKVLLLISGVAAGGKDALRDKMKELAPSYFYRLVTGTSRSIRPNEQHGVDHYYYESTQAFLDAVARGEFLETIEQSPGRWYGLPKQSLIDALERPEPVIHSDVEMTAWPKVERFLEEKYKDNPGAKPFVLKVFVMPEKTAVDYFTDWLPKKRTDFIDRSIRAGWELRKAPINAHLLVSNVFDQGGNSLDLEGKSLIKIMRNLLLMNIQFPSYSFPAISPGIGTTTDILAFQNWQIKNL